MPLPHKIGADTWSEIVLPTSLEERYELLAAYLSCEEIGERHRVFAAALALCWPLLRKHVEVNGRATYTGRVLVYGRQVMDALLTNEDPAPRLSVLTAGREALEAVDRSLNPILEATADPEGFSRPAGTPPSGGSSSPSSDTPASPPAALAPSTPG